jgi:hypothetical protein
MIKIKGQGKNTLCRHWCRAPSDIWTPHVFQLHSPGPPNLCRQDRVRVLDQLSHSVSLNESFTRWWWLGPRREEDMGYYLVKWKG